MRYLGSLILVFSFALASIVFSQTKIMPLGDSITKGVGSTGNDKGYRKPLWDQLKINYSVNFVGSLSDGSGFDPDHEGHPGWKSSQILSNIQGWLSASDPDMVIFHIGTNDISANRSTQDIIDDIDATLTQIWNYDSNIRVFLCSIIPRTDSKNSNTIALNNQIVNLVNQHKGSKPITHVDQYSVIANVSNWQNTLMADYLHPNDTGYQRMADEFFDTLINYLSPVTPVELIAFHAIAEEKGVRLVWQTASESNNFGFEIEHSRDGQRFETIGFVLGHGTSNTTHLYDFLHETHEPGLHAYRLKQIDTDGSFTYSGVVEVKLSAPASFTLLPSYPNPLSLASGRGQTNITVDLPQSADIRIAVYDLLGREVIHLFSGAQMAGRHTFLWDGRSNTGLLVPTGTYFIRAETPDGAQLQKLQIIR